MADLSSTGTGEGTNKDQVGMIPNKWYHIPDKEDKEEDSDEDKFLQQSGSFPRQESQESQESTVSDWDASPRNQVASDEDIELVEDEPASEDIDVVQQTSQKRQNIKIPMRFYDFY